jgi:hypothetical protein
LLMKLSWKIDKNWQLFVRSMSKVKVIDVYKNLTHITVKKNGPFIFTETQHIYSWVVEASFCMVSVNLKGQAHELTFVRICKKKNHIKHDSLIHTVGWNLSQW